MYHDNWKHMSTKNLYINVLNSIIDKNINHSSSPSWKYRKILNSHSPWNPRNNLYLLNNSSWRTEDQLSRIWTTKDRMAKENSKRDGDMITKETQCPNAAKGQRVVWACEPQFAEIRETREWYGLLSYLILKP